MMKRIFRRAHVEIAKTATLKQKVSLLFSFQQGKIAANNSSQTQKLADFQ